MSDGIRTVTLGSVIANATPGFASGQREDSGLLQLRMNNVETDGSFNWTKVVRVPLNKKADRYLLTRDDVLFNNTNSVELVGKTATFHEHHEPVVYSNHFTRLRVDPTAMDAAYLGHWLRQHWRAGTFARLCTRWVGQAAVKWAKLRELPIPLPPLPEQRRVAAVLDAADALRRRHLQAADLAGDLLAALSAAHFEPSQSS